MGNSYQKVVEPHKEALNKVLTNSLRIWNSDNDNAIIALLESGADPMIIIKDDTGHYELGITYYPDVPVLYRIAVLRDFSLFKVVYKYAENPNNLELLKYVITHANKDGSRVGEAKLIDIYNFILQAQPDILKTPNDMVLIKHILKEMSESPRRMYARLCKDIVQKNKVIMEDPEIRIPLMKAACTHDMPIFLKMFSSEVKYDYSFEKGILLVIAAEYNYLKIIDYLVSEQHLLDIKDLAIKKIIKYAIRRDNLELITRCTTDFKPDSEKEFPLEKVLDYAVRKNSVDLIALGTKRSKGD